MNEAPLPWVRYWVPSGQAVGMARWLDQHGWMTDQADGFVRTFERDPDTLDPQTLDQLAKVPCLVLLGVAGAGKSVEVRRIATGSAAEEERGARLLIECAVGTEELFGHLRSADAFKRWRRGEGDLFLILDGVDETPDDPRKLARALRQELGLDRSALSRLSLRLTCRQTAWSRIEWLADSLRALWGPDGFRVVELGPLKFEDAVSGLQRWTRSGMTDSEARRFLVEAASAGMSSFVRWPLGLRLLASSALEPAVDTRRSTIFVEGLTRLCVSPQERIPPAGDWQCSPLARLALAARVAASIVLGGKAGVWIGGGPPPHRALLSVDELTGGKERVDGVRVVPADRAQLYEIFSECAIFRASNSGDIRFEHDDFASFLAARFLVTRRVEPSAVLDLLRPPGSLRGRVVAGFEPLAAWLGALLPDVAEQVAAAQPEALLAAPSPAIPVGARAAAVDAVLQGLADGRIHPYEPWLEGRGVPLDHPGLVCQLSLALEDRSEAVRVGAARLGAALGPLALLPALVARALDTEESEIVRVVSIDAVGKLATSTGRNRLRVLLATLPASDPSGRIRGAALSALWPQAVSTRELFDHLVPGIGEAFLHDLAAGALEATLQPGDLLPALRWAEGVLTGDLRDISRGRVAEAVVRVALVGASGSVPEDEFRATVRRWIVHGSQPGRSWSGIWHRDWSRNSVRALIRTILDVGASIGPPNYIEDEQRALVMALKHKLFLHGHLAWLLEGWLGAKTDAVKAWWLWASREGVLKLIRQRWGGWSEEATAAGERLWRELETAVDKEPEYKAAVGDLLDPEHRFAALVRDEATGRGRADAPPAPDEGAVAASMSRLRELLSPLSVPPGPAWPEVSWLLQTQPEGRSATLAAASDLTERLLWREANQDLKEAVRTCAIRWLEETPSRWKDWIATGRIPSLVPRAVWALVLVGPESVGAGLWSSWSPPLLVAEAPEVDKPAVSQLLEAGAKSARSEILAGLGRLLTAESWLSQRAWRRLGSLLDDGETREEAAAVVVEQLAAGNLKDVQGAFEALLQAGSPRARRTALGTLAGEASTEAAEAIASALLLSDPGRSWTELFDYLTGNSERGERVVERVTRRFDFGGPRPERSLSAEAVGQLLSWLIQRFPYSRDSRRSGAFTETPRTRAEDWRDALLRELQGRADEDALQAVRRLQKSFPELEWLGRVAGEIEQRVEVEAWVPLRVDEVLKLGTVRPVRDERDLLRAVERALDEIQTEMRAGDPPSADHLWDEGGTPRSPRRPRSESFLSDWLRRELSRAEGLQSVSITRESETLPPGPGRRGQELDLLLSKLVRGASGEHMEISCLIEVKGAWHPNLLGGLHGQTADYLRRSRRRSGLLLVVWFDPEQWDDSGREARRRRSVINQGPAEALAAKLEAEVATLRESGFAVAARVLDASL